MGNLNMSTNVDIDKIDYTLTTGEYLSLVEMHAKDYREGLAISADPDEPLHERQVAHQRWLAAAERLATLGVAVPEGLMPRPAPSLEQVFGPQDPDAAAWA